MKLVTKGTIVGALMMLAVPATAMAGPCYPYRHYDRAGCNLSYRRRDLRNDWRDVSRDRYNLHRDLAEGRYGAARAQEADIRHEMADIRGDQFALRRESRGYPYPY
jgi:hypothetical protein